MSDNWLTILDSFKFERRREAKLRRERKKASIVQVAEIKSVAENKPVATGQEDLKFNNIVLKGTSQLHCVENKHATIGQVVKNKSDPMRKSNRRRPCFDGPRKRRQQKKRYGNRY